jgi:WD40 repeat protein
MCLRGHEATVTCLGVKGDILASGSADTTIRLWNKHTGRPLRVLAVHQRGVNCLHLGAEWMATGGADEHVRVWDVERKSADSINVTCNSRLEGHNSAVTAVQFGGLEVRAIKL